MPSNMYSAQLHKKHSDQEVYRQTLEYASDYLATQTERPPFPPPRSAGGSGAI